MDAAIEANAGIVQELQQPSYLCLVIQFRAMRALLAGRFAESERLAQEALAIGQSLQTETAKRLAGGVADGDYERLRLASLVPCALYACLWNTTRATSCSFRTPVWWKTCYMGLSTRRGCATWTAPLSNG